MAGDGFLGNLLAWVNGHPGLAMALVFAVAVGESIFLVGLLIPGAVFMFAFGALIGADALPLGATFAAAIIGSLIGDGASYLLGRLYRGRLDALPGLARFPGVVARGEVFFARHGGKGIVLGRMVGALRPIMPTVAGAAGLSPPRFVLMDVLATVAWSLIYILPGVVFGASLDLAAQVATRLAILLVAVVAIVWGTTVAARFVIAAGKVAARHYAERLLAWSHRHRRLGLLGPALADPRQPELPALAVAAGVLMTITGLIYVLVWGWTAPHYPMRFDALTFYLTQRLHTSISDGCARVVAELGSPLIYLPFAGVIAGVLTVMGNWRAAGHWVAALAFSALITVLLRWWLAVPAPVTLFNGATVNPLFLAGGGQDMILFATVYGLAGMIVAARRAPTLRPYYISLTIAGIVLIALARLYLGLDWASDLIIGLTVAFAWVNLLVLCYRRQRPRRVRGAPVLGVLAGFVVMATLLTLIPDSALNQLPMPRHQPPLALADWTGQGHDQLAARIRDISGRTSAPLNVQAAGHRHALVAALHAAGWQNPPALDAGQVLRSLAPDHDIRALPVLPRVHNGHRATITLVYPARGDAALTRRWVLRLWPTDRVTAGVRTPLWVGMVDSQRIDHRLHLLTTAVDTSHFNAGAKTLARVLASAGADIQSRLIPEPHGPVLLFWPRDARVDAKVAPD